MCYWKLKQPHYGLTADSDAKAIKGRRYWRKWWAAGAVLFVALLRWAWYPYDRYLGCPGPDLDRSTLVGTYLPVQESLEYMKKLGYVISDIRLVIRPDGSFTFFNSPDVLWGGSPEEPPVPVYPPRKNIMCAGDWWVSQDLGYERAWEMRLSFGHCSWPAQLVGTRIPYFLYFTIGDPDFGRSLIMEKVTAVANR